MLRWTKKLTVIVVAVFAMALLAAGCIGDKKLTLATGPSTGTYLPVGKAIASVLNQSNAGVEVTAEITPGSTANIDILKEGRADLAIVQNDVAYYAMNGTEMFEGQEPVKLFRLTGLYPEACQFVVLKESNIRSINDLKGRRVCVGAEGSGMETNTRQILAVHGITYKDILPQYLSFAEGMLALRAGNVDVVCLAAGHPTSIVRDVSKHAELRLLPIEQDKINELKAKLPFYTEIVIPAGTYQGMTEDTLTVAVMATLVCTDKVNEKMGYNITKAIFSNLPPIHGSHAMGEQITSANGTKGASIPMNPGAEKFFNEQNK